MLLTIAVLWLLTAGLKLLTAGLLYGSLLLDKLLPPTVKVRLPKRQMPGLSARYGMKLPET